jgi:hypothetical protein
MAASLKGKIVSVEKVETAETALSAVEALHDLNPPGVTEGPARRLGLRGL